ncbi:unnamed protein product [Prorocentrum cordatum]|uniref:Uncharacterized protein n=1 Tax=Prorocentrum cordatum TaxID=2364126 RepID=A0ABN9RUA3_9DINO|nr:unnamed protein product [Polarella glacialis]
MAALRFAERTGPGVTDLCEDEGVLSQMVHSVFEDVHWISPDPAKFENTPPQVAPITRRANNDLCIQTSGEHRTQGADRSTPTSMSERRVPQRVVADEVENDTCSVRSA